MTSLELHNAVNRGFTDTVKILIEAGADLNVVDKDGNTALHHSIYDGHTEIAKALINAGADVTIADKDGSTAIHFAVCGNQIEIVKDLIKANTDVTVALNDGRTALHLAFNPSIAKMLIYSGSDINAKNNRGKTPLDSQLENVDQNLEVAEILINHGASFDHIDLDNLQDEESKNVLIQAHKDMAAKQADSLVNSSVDLTSSKKISRAI